MPYQAAINMRLDMATALLNDERLDNTHQRKPKESNASPAKSNASHEGITYVATKRKFSKPK
ncbi:hypothetical protein BEN76_03875 [Acinetobacter soli]|uniref:Uncharacterized protein n=1 Tax=Acinetobacter soli TaxID=487316 RepID=A0A1P8EG60_9GAMM|nr:hypothetical protein BEN76_03875 [Acinetobacter soli]